MKNPQPQAKLAFINRLSAHLAEAVNIGFARVPDDLCKSGGAMHVYAWFWAPNYHAAEDGHDRVFIDYASPSRYLGTFG